MGILRAGLAFEGQFTQVPNEWARDKKLSRRARGLLTEILSHRVGWRLTIEGLAKEGTEGRHAIRAAVDELREAGYLEVEQGRGSRGQFGEVEYRLTDPTASRKSDTGRFSASGSADGGSADGGEPNTREHQSSEEHLEEDQTSSSDGVAVLPTSSDVVVRLCDLLAERVRANGHRVGVVGQKWWSACDRLMRLDGYSAEQIEWMIRWSTSDEFWAANIRSMPTLREKFSTLVAQAKRKASRPSAPGERAASVVDMGRRIQAAAERAS